MGWWFSWFDVSKVDDYYKLTNHKEDEMVVGVRDGVEYDNNKRNQADFALWFTKSKFEDQDLKWSSPFGIVKHVEIIGEAVYMLTDEFRVNHPEVDWDVIEGMRHVLVHGYYRIRPMQLWNTIMYDIPKLKPFIESYLKE